ncbi:MAG: IS630 transposase-related protein, partial [Sulfuricurvum sp.]|nr:IS630 transposase-related protein [Sulfuricurvum sp.]
RISTKLWEKMGKPYSTDLRKRVLEYIEETKDKVKASQVFKVGIATIYRWIARKTQTGSVTLLLKSLIRRRLTTRS